MSEGTTFLKQSRETNLSSVLSELSDYTFRTFDPNENLRELDPTATPSFLTKTLEYSKRRIIAPLILGAFALAGCGSAPSLHNTSSLTAQKQA